MAGNEDPPPDPGARYDALLGEDFGRILALSDGVFAFAMTLLVISLVVPTATSSHQLTRELVSDWQPIFGFVFGFVMIALWWIIHNRTFQYLRRFDNRLVWINMAILIQISLMPFVLGVYGGYSGDGYQAAVVLFAGIQVTLGLTNLVLYEYARRAKLLKPDIPEWVSDSYTKRGLGTALVFAISIAVSFYSVSIAQYCWFGIILAQHFALGGARGSRRGGRRAREEKALT